MVLRCLAGFLYVIIIVYKNSVFYHYNRRFLSLSYFERNITMADINIMQDASEIIHYDMPQIPLSVRKNHLTDYPFMQAPCHWHEDLEWIYILKGAMHYDINGKKILLKENDWIMVNARQMHHGTACKRQECEFICILFHPTLFTGCQTVCRNYLLPVTENSRLEYLHSADLPEDCRGTAGLLSQIADLKDRHTPGYEMEIIGLMHILWGRIYRCAAQLSPSQAAEQDPDISVQKAMVSYIHRHYSEKITLDEIAAAGNVCRNKCCLIFKRYLQQTPIDFLNTYRLRISSHLLQHTDLSVTRIALSCGFHHLSYFSGLFQRCYGCTPRQYRSRGQKEDTMGYTGEKEPI